jgi:hypothetical protein
LTLRAPRDEEATNRAASLIARALIELQQAAGTDSDGLREELAASRAALQQLVQRLDQEMAVEKEQRLAIAGQLTNLATSLDRLVSHLQGLSDLMSDMMKRFTEPAPAASTTSQPSFPAGGEGVSLTLASVPGFQALMDIQKALMAMDQVSGASVERFQEGESRILLHLRTPATADDLAGSLRKSTGHTIVVEESRPELLRLRLKVVAG